MKRIKWTEEEVYLLVEVYLENIEKSSNEITQACANLSNTLRQLALKRGIEIDDMYRNENGINMQFHTIDYFFTDGEKGLSGGSNLARNVVNEYKSNSSLFFDKLSKIKEKR